YDSYFESNKSGLKGDSSYLAFTDQKAFDMVLGATPPVMGQKREYLPKDAFDKQMATVVIKRGKAITKYKVEKVTADGDTLYVQYTAKEEAAGGGTANYASPLVVAVDKGKYKQVVFIENGKKAGTADINK